MSKWLRTAFFAVAILFLGGTFLNASWLAPTPAGRVGLVAHRGEGVGSCDTAPGAAAYPVLPDNSIDAIKETRQLGASLIGIDVAPDGSLAPAMCPNSYGANAPLAQVLETARPKALMFTFTGGDPKAADTLLAALKAAGHDPVASGDAFYAAHEAGPVARMRALLPAGWIFSAESANACTDAYRKTGWFGLLPHACDHGTMFVALDRQGSLAGWPNRLLARMKDGHVIVVAPGSANGGPPKDPRGLDLPEQFGEIPNSFDGLVWTDDLWNLGPALYPRVDNRSRAEQDAGEAAMNRRRAKGV